jgi:hypothetical protein
MGIEALAVFPAFVAMVAMAIILISGLRNIRHMFKAALFSIVLMVCTTAVLFSTVFIFEFLGLAIVGEIFYLGAVGVMIYGGLKYGRKRFYFTTGELMLQGIIAVCGCAATSLFFLGLTVRI